MIRRAKHGLACGDRTLHGNVVRSNATAWIIRVRRSCAGKGSIEKGSDDVQYDQKCLTCKSRRERCQYERQHYRGPGVRFGHGTGQHVDAHSQRGSDSQGRQIDQVQDAGQLLLARFHDDVLVALPSGHHLNQLLPLRNTNRKSIQRPLVFDARSPPIVTPTRFSRTCRSAILKRCMCTPAQWWHRVRSLIRLAVTSRVEQHRLGFTIMVSRRLTTSRLVSLLRPTR